MVDTSILFTPFKLNGLELKNRIVMAPMTRSHSPGGVPGADVCDYYTKRAAAEVGLILSEGTTIDRPGASNDVNVPNFVTDEALAGWSNIIESVHEKGGKMGPQLWHVGMMRKPGTGPFPDAPSDSPSGRTHTGKQVMPEPTMEEVADMIDAYAKAAGHAARLGFDVIEIHGAHGYLIDQFFWDVMNTRSDRYGGTLAERATFAAEIVRACRSAVGAEMPILFRFSQWKQQDFTARLAETPESLEGFLSVLSDAGVDVFHCSQRRFWEPEFEGSSLNLAGWTKKLSGKPSVSVGSVGLRGDFISAFGGASSETTDLGQLVERMENGEFDLIAVGRALLQDPLWAEKVKNGNMDQLMPFDVGALTSLS